MTTHFIGIGGIGMSALARILLDRKEAVSGSDQRESGTLQVLRREGAEVGLAHSADRFSSDARVIYSTAIPKENPELVQAHSLGCSVVHRADLLRELMSGYKTIAVAGTHGKTSTSALLAHVLLEAGADPAFALGGILPQVERNGRHGQGDYFVAEADESDGSFLKMDPYGAIVTNVEADHLDHWGTLDKIHSAFATFVDSVQSADHLFWWGDDPYLRQLAPKGIAYGFGNHPLSAANLRHNGFSTLLDITFEGVRYADVEIALPGPHNALNALAVFGLSLRLGVPEAELRSALKSYTGVGRRLERKGETRGVLVIDDYAHHPTEVRETLRSLRTAVKERRIVALFQPHRYSRLSHCLHDFASAFGDADQLIVTDIYSAGEAPLPGLTPHSLVDRVAQPQASYVPKEELVAHLHRSLRPHDVLITLGAGDITHIADQLNTTLQRRPTAKLRIGLAFGGTSLEHPISISSARFFDRHLDRSLYDVELYGVTTSGQWIHAIDAFEQLEGGVTGAPLSAPILDSLRSCDLVIPCFHGPKGEDGTFASLLELLDIPYIGCGASASAIAMDKALTKHLAQSIGIPTPPFVDLHRGAPIPPIDLPYPLFVKPAHLGSSFGVTRVDTPEDLPAAIEAAFALDTRVIVEQGIMGREIEVALLGDEIAPPCEIHSSGQVNTYDGKYSPDGTPISYSPDLTPSQLANLRSSATAIYRALGARGFARIDFFLDRNRLYLNEVNPFPGLTPTSPYPVMWETAGLAPAHLCDRLITLALAHSRC